MRPAWTARLGTVDQVLGLMLPIACWALYAPLGIKYTGFLVCVLLAALSTRQRGLWPAVWRQPGAAPLFGWVALMVLSALWSPAAWSHIGSHVWLYCLPLGTLFLIVAVPPATARHALGHFVAASAAVGAIVLLQHAGALPSSWLWSSTAGASGNQRIVTSLLLALGAALGAWRAAQPAAWRSRAPWLAAAGIALIAVTTQDRRTGMVILPFMLLAWALAARRGLVIKAAMVGLVGLAALLVWNTSQTVRERFAEGAAEVQTYTSSDAAVTSWGQRLRMFERSAEMVRERPFMGHGVASWQGLWNQRVAPGTLLAANSTPHNEYLLVAVQIGIPGAMLLAAWLLTMIGCALRAGAIGVPAVMMWVALALTGLANAVLRDAKFSLALLLLAALASACARPCPRPPPPAPSLPHPFPTRSRL